jgi:hypothetical protein
MRGFSIGVLGLLLGACASGAAPGTTNLGFEIACAADPCGWSAVEGTYRYGGTWHPADPGLDMSGEGRVVVEQRATFEAPRTRDYVLEATTLRDPGVNLAFELAWYRAVASTTDYWSQNPELLRTDHIDITEEGLARWQRTSSVAAEAGGLILRIIKGGSGRCWVDEIAYHPY